VRPGCRTLSLVRARRRAEHDGRQLVAPRLEGVPVRRRNAEQLCDHDRRERERELRDHVHGLPGAHPVLHGVDALVDDSLRERPQALDAFGVKARRAGPRSRSWWGGSWKTIHTAQQLERLAENRSFVRRQPAFERG
jgi:hypothetical protein